MLRLKASCRNRRSFPWHFSLPADHAHRGDGQRFTLEIARVLVRFDRVASFIINANHSVMRTTEKLLTRKCFAQSKPSSVSAVAARAEKRQQEIIATLDTTKNQASAAVDEGTEQVATLMEQAPQQKQYREKRAVALSGNSP